MTFKLESVVTDPKKVKGVWIPANRDHPRICIARLNNEAYNEAVLKILADLPENVSRESRKLAVRPAVATHILLDWDEDFTYQNEKLKFDYETVMKVFEIAPDFYDSVLLEAANVENFRISNITTIAKN